MMVVTKTAKLLLGDNSSAATLSVISSGRQETTDSVRNIQHQFPLVQTILVDFAFVFLVSFCLLGLEHKTSKVTQAQVGQQTDFWLTAIFVGFENLAVKRDWKPTSVIRLSRRLHSLVFIPDKKTSEVSISACQYL